ncbi:hypothetical protein [Psychrobacter sanguinis]|uniref:hypothetical protein n=1 Tax=Psychrobacter sanguinis TaxID=861445 RepID=UPI0019184AF7|nr:hypothetical protein [Psychrobacter sanguinis]MCC3309163.1 hypothetical protein [Psychrobacter sanguinis]UEC26439.1 hypothetical protein LK453_04765 [Psychrobacter sanguinis]
MSETCPNCNNVLSYDDLESFMDNLAASDEDSFEMNECCPKCGEDIILKKDGHKYSMKKSDGSFAMIGHK